VLRAQHVEHPVEAFLVDHVADLDEIQVAGADTRYQMLLGDDSHSQVLLVLALDLPGFDVLDDCRAVIWVNNRFADGECHVPSTPS